MENKELLAKSNPKVTLRNHIQDALNIAGLLKQTIPKISEVLNSKFWDTLKLIIIFHDLGKAHVEFQKLLMGEKNAWNKNRHELFSFPYIEAINCIPEIKNQIKLVVLGHHKDFEFLDKFLDEYYISQEDSIELLEVLGQNSRTYIDDFLCLEKKEILNIISSFDVSLDGLKIINPHNFIKSYLKKPVKLNELEGLTIILLLGAFNHCDHLSSAFLDHIYQFKKETFQFLEQKRKYLIDNKNDFYFHQLKANSTSGNLILTAPTGSGKTESAMLWLKNQIEEIGQGRCFYVLPFTASINAMFERLSKNFGKDYVGMLHGKLPEYLNNYLLNEQYDKDERNNAIKAKKELFKTIISPLKIITPFQLLKNLFGLRFFEKGIFEWVGSYFIFDEIHAYDAKTFAQIIVLLEFITVKISAKVMIMTATLPTFLKVLIKKAIGTFTEINADDKVYKSFIRHKVILKEGVITDIENLQMIEKKLIDGKKVLVVCNTVKQSQFVFLTLMKENNSNLLLHSYFNGKDRFKIENSILNEEVNLLVGTQSIEVSLDIDYDIIFTEPAPLDALLQRFGRVNRQRNKGICECYVFKGRNSSDKFIYKDDEIINKTLKVLELMENTNYGIINEEKLQGYIDYVYPNWNSELENEYQNIYDLLKSSFNELSPLIYSRIKEEEYYKQFDGIPVLPITLEKEYLNSLKNYDFIAADSLLVKIKSNMFAAWINPQNDNIRIRTCILGSDKTYTLKYYVTNKMYTPELGLIRDQNEDWNNFIEVEII